MLTNDLKQLGFQLAYLALLTKNGIKPLSRWEDDLSPDSEIILTRLNLKTKRIVRFTHSGKPVVEHIFSISDKCLNLYENYFNYKMLDSSPLSIWLEGILFGYPSCCVENFIKNGYSRNNLDNATQGLLFHRACPNCKVSQILADNYRKVYESCLEIFNGDEKRQITVRLQTKSNKNNKKFNASLAAMFIAASLSAGDVDKHLIPLSQQEDSDLDYLKDTEELILKSNPYNLDENNNKIPDGIDLATLLYNLIISLPNSPTNNQVYAIPHYAFGIETCDICGETVNMGHIEIVNPMENQSIIVPFIALHYLEKGGFGYSGTVHKGRINPVLLKTIIQSTGFAHFIKQNTGFIDSDSDGLDDYEERHYLLNPQAPDTDKNGIIDSIDLARNLLLRLKALTRAASIETGPIDKPFIIEHPMDGYEICPVCGDTITMDWWLVYNPVNKLSISIPSMALHYLEHGGFSWSGGNMFGGNGRVNPLQLKAVLDCEGDGHLVPVENDADEDGLPDFLEKLYEFSPLNPDTDNDGIKDGIALAKTYFNKITALPRAETNGIYVIEHPLRGIVYCPICGESINMGYIEIINKPRNSTLNLSYLSLHYLEHGSFINTAERYINPVELSDAFKDSITFASAPSGLKFKWKGEAGRKYIVYISDDLFGGWEKYCEFNGDGEEIEFTYSQPGTSPSKFFKISTR
ncbi:MAG: hypothetical protein ACP5T0_09455 [Verrucomicrobiia bacterium]